MSILNRWEADKNSVTFVNSEKNMNLKEAVKKRLTENLEKARGTTKYKRRWKGKDGKWKYEYYDKKGREKGSAEPDKKMSMRDIAITISEMTFTEYKSFINKLYDYVTTDDATKMSPTELITTVLSMSKPKKAKLGVKKKRTGSGTKKKATRGKDKKKRKERSDKGLKRALGLNMSEFIDYIVRLKNSIDLTDSKGLPQMSNEIIDIIKANKSQKLVEEKEKEVKKPKPEKKKPDTETKKPGTTKVLFKDVGKKIGGAKKDLWAEKFSKLSLDELEKDPEEAYQIVTKDTVLSKFDPEFYKEQGYTSNATQLIGMLYKSILKRPGDSPENRKAYVAYLRDLEHVLRNARTTADVIESIGDLLYSKAQIKSVYPVYDIWGRSKTKHEDKNASAQKEMMTVLGSKFTNLVTFVVYTLRNQHTKNTIRGYGINKYLNSNEKWSLRGSSKFQVKTGNLSNKRYWDLDKQFNKWVKDDKETGGNDWGWTTEVKPKKDRKKKKTWIRKAGAEVERVGGKEIKIKTAKPYQSKFNIRAVEYGNYVATDKVSGEYHTQRCAEAFSDLADILGIDDKQIAFNGRLAIAFGARGSGRASAHYEPVKKVINLTKFKGGGSLAHEWGHFLDHIMHNVENKQGGSGKTGFLSLAKEGDTSIKLAVTNVMSSMRSLSVDENIPMKFKEQPNLTDKEKKTFKIFLKNANSNRMQARMFSRSDRDKRETPLDFAVATFKRNADKWFEKGAADNQDLLKDYIQYAVNEYTKESPYSISENIKELPKTMNVKYEQKTHFQQFADSMGGYWRKDQELFARAFESYVQDKLKSQGRKSTYLVAGTDSDYGDFQGIYPVGKERDQINKEFDKLFEVLRKENTLEKALKFAFIPKKSILGFRRG